MKKIVVLMSVGLLTLGSYSFSIAMQDDGWDDEYPYGLFDSSDQNDQSDVEELTLSVEQLSLIEQQQKMRDSLKTIKALGLSKSIVSEIIEQGKRRGGGRVLSDDIRLLEEKRAELSEKKIESINERRKSYQEDVDSTKKNVLYELSQRVHKPVDARAFNALVGKYANAQDQLFRAKDRVCSEEEERALMLDQQHAAYQKQLMSGGVKLAPLNPARTCKHEKCSQIKPELSQPETLAHALNVGQAEKEEILHGLQGEVARRRAALMKLAFASGNIVNMSEFKFNKHYQVLADQCFKGPEGIQYGLDLAFKNGDILALITYSDYLNRYFQSNFVFDYPVWTQLLSTFLLTTIRISQDAHAVAAVDAFIEAMAQEHLPVDTRFVAWKQSMNKWFGKTDTQYAQLAQEGVLAYMSRIWAPRIINAMKSEAMPPFKIVLAHVKEVMAAIDPAAIPTPAVVCCLHGNVSWNASNALEQAFRMFDFTENRQEGLEIVLHQLEACKTWTDFMTNFLGVVVPQ